MLNGLTWSLSVCQFTDNEDTVSILFGLFIFFIESNQKKKSQSFNFAFPVGIPAINVECDYPT